MNNNQHHTQEVDQVFENGWQWVPDMSHPKNKEMGFYPANLRDDAIGWYTKPGTRKAEPTGDSRPRWQAAQNIVNYWM